MMLRTSLNMADIWTKDVAARLITSWQKYPMLYDVADKHYLSSVLKERAFREFIEELAMIGNFVYTLLYIFLKIHSFQEGQ